MLARIDLFDAPLYMGVAMRKGSRNWVSFFFGVVHKLVQHTSWRSELNEMVHKLVWVEK